MIEVLAAFAVTVVLVPTPIGVGPEYRPTAELGSGDPIGRLGCRTRGARYGVHLELFAHGRVVVVPAGIGLTAVRARRFGTIEPAGCSYPARTRTPTGIVEVLRGSRLRLGDLFRIWGQPLSHTRFAGFRATGPLLAFVDGRRSRLDPRAIPLTRHSRDRPRARRLRPAHTRFRFPGGL